MISDVVMVGNLLNKTQTFMQTEFNKGEILACTLGAFSRNDSGKEEKKGRLCVYHVEVNFLSFHTKCTCLHAHTCSFINYC